MSINFDTCTQKELEEYCMNDVHLTKLVWNQLEQYYLDNTRVYRLEDAVAKSVQRQCERGVVFDTTGARVLRTKIACNMLNKKVLVDPFLPTVPIPESKLRYPPKKQFKKDGTPSVLAEKYFPHLCKTTAGTYEFEHPMGSDTWHALPFNEPLETEYKISISQTAALKTHLMSQGWKPTMWNYKTDEATGHKIKTSPKLYDGNKNLCPGLTKMKTPYIKDIAAWLTLRNRMNVIESDNGTGWLNHPKLIKEARLPADADTLGANTGRFTHKVVANVPRVTSLYGKEMRGLFTVPEGRTMVGWDASALEARIEAHYTHPFDGGKYAKTILTTDVHDVNASMLGIDRDMAKSFKYAITYGARPARLATLLDISLHDATELYAEYWDRNPSLEQLKQAITRQWAKSGKLYILGLDGRKIWTRSEHSLMNALFQSGGAIAMKYAMIIAEKSNKDLDAYALIRYHDEEQWDSAPEDATECGENGVKSIELAGKYLKLNVGLTGEYKIGKTWADTH
jgi:DNA polymerase I-like protein with 3'-5' exonuclease and polymerase domains